MFIFILSSLRPYQFISIFSLSLSLYHFVLFVSHTTPSPPKQHRRTHARALMVKIYWSIRNRIASQFHVRRKTKLLFEGASILATRTIFHFTRVQCTFIGCEAANLWSWARTLLCLISPIPTRAWRIFRYYERMPSMLQKREYMTI